MAVDLDRADPWLQVGDEYFVNPRRSPSGNFVVAARDRGYANGEEVPGACVLLAGDALLFRHTVRRGTNPHVSDSGLVIVEDWGSERLEGALLAFDAKGSTLWTLRLRANIFTSGMSVDGTLAFLSTCNSPDPDHGGRTFLLETRTGSLLWARKGWGDVSFQGNQLMAEVRFASCTEHFPFDGHGHLGPDHALAETRLRDERGRGQHWYVLPKLEAALKGRPVDAAQIVALLDQIEGKVDDFPASAKAKLARIRGDLAELHDEFGQAIAWWEQALVHDPKAAVKRRLDRARARADARRGPSGG